MDAEEYLKRLILLKCEIDSISLKDFRVISEKIFIQDQNYLSENTIKKFFGITDDKATFSSFVYNSLSLFVGFESYEEYEKHFQIISSKDER
ncbi:MULTISPECIES: hypothetical protein [Pedobacter]|uniref:hypothetical protein n=1 Tax=Pedobacter TaxID=84567 RepID=UPI001E5F75CF|nr:MULTISPECIES: hypothetical protein [Pedobacter]